MDPQNLDPSPNKQHYVTNTDWQKYVATNNELNQKLQTIKQGIQQLHQIANEANSKHTCIIL